MTRRPPPARAAPAPEDRGADTHPAGMAPAFALAAPELPDLPKGDLLLGYQQRAIAAMATTGLLVIEKSRRIGLTWGLAAAAALTAAASRGAEGGMDVWYMGTEMQMAREFIRDVGMWARAFGLVSEDEGERVLDDSDQDVRAFSVRFASGFRVTAIPSVPRALRGRQGLVLVDEAAFHADIDEVLKAAMALLIWGGRVVVVSTHDGIDNPFNALIEEVRTGRRAGRVMTITWSDAMADGFYERVMLRTGEPATPEGKIAWEARIRSFYTEEQAAEELDVIPRAHGGSWLDPTMLAACGHPEAGLPIHYGGGLTYIGRDVARRRDFSVIAALELCGPVLWERERYEAVGATFAHQDAAMDAMFARYRVARAKIDQTGMGEKVVEDAQGRHGSLRVEGVLFSAQRKLSLATALRARVEAGTIRMRLDAETRRDLLAVKRAGKSAGALAEGSVHPDRFWALALACEAADEGFVDLSAIQTTGARAGAPGAGGGAGHDPWAGFQGAGLDARGF
jgi:phage FluMu gp28-like protein